MNLCLKLSNQIINLDFANDHVPYDASVDVRDLVSLEVLHGNLIYFTEFHF
jgi:hypothetical protein